MFKRKKIAEASIPTSSMADIAFLLLLFFLVATTIDIDSGIGLTLPQYVSEVKNVKVPKDRITSILINENGDVILDGRKIPLAQIKNQLKPKIQSKINLPIDKKLIVSVMTDRKTKYNSYIQALDQIKQSYFEARDEYSKAYYGKKFRDLPEDVQSIVKNNKVPIIISLAEPESIKK